MTRATAAVLEPAARSALAAYLLAIADDELILGHRHSEWTGFAPDIESDVALSSVAQEEIGHARLFYERVCELTGGDPDTLAYTRPPEEFRNAVLVERPNGDWGFTLVRMVLYDHADAVRLEALAAGTVESLADLARTLRREEKYHLLYGEQWLRRLAQATADSRTRVQEALERAWPEAEALFEPVSGHDALVASGALAAPGTLLAHWHQVVVPLLQEMGLKVRTPAAGEGGVGGAGRTGGHSDDLRVLLDEMTSVWRSEPGAKW